MRLTRGKKLALGVATAWPLFYLFLVFALIASFVAAASFGGGPTFITGRAPHGVPTVFLVLFPLHFLTVILSMGLLIVYVLHAIKNPKLSPSDRQLWAVMIFIGSFVAVPTYYFMHVLPLTDDPPA